MQMRKKLTVWLMTLMACVAMLGGTALAAPEHNTVQVTGRAEMEASPDMATVYASLEKKASTAVEARQALAEQMDQVRRTLLAQGIPAGDIKNVNYSLNPNYIYTNNKQKLDGYIAQVDYRITVNELDKLSDVLDRGIDKGLEISQVNFGLKNESILERGLLTQAVKNARSRAEAVATAGGRTLGQLVGADLGSVSGMHRNIPTLYRSAAMEMSKDSATTLSPGTLTVSATVQLLFDLK